MMNGFSVAPFVETVKYIYIPKIHTQQRSTSYRKDEIRPALTRAPWAAVKTNG